MEKYALFVLGICGDSGGLRSWMYAMATAVARNRAFYWLFEEVADKVQAQCVERYAAFALGARTI